MGYVQWRTGSEADADFFDFEVDFCCFLLDRGSPNDMAPTKRPGKPFSYSSSVKSSTDEDTSRASRRCADLSEQAWDGEVARVFDSESSTWVRAVAAAFAPPRSEDRTSPDKETLQMFESTGEGGDGCTRFWIADLPLSEGFPAWGEMRLSACLWRETLPVHRSSMPKIYRKHLTTAIPHRR